MGSQTNSSSPAFFGLEVLSVVALDQKRGHTAWKRHDFENGYASPLLIDVDGQQQLVCFMAREVVGLDPAGGKLKWRYPHENQWRNNIVNPLWGPDNLLFVSSEGHGGSCVLHVTRDGANTTVNPRWFTRKIRISHRNAIRIGDYIYASSGDFGPAFFTAVHTGTGRIAWQHRGFSEACCLLADGRLLILDEDGYLALVTATPEAFTVHAKAKVLEKQAWTMPTLIGRRLYLRDRKVIMAMALP